MFSGGIVFFFRLMGLVCLGGLKIQITKKVLKVSDLLSGIEIAMNKKEKLKNALLEA